MKELSLEQVGKRLRRVRSQLEMTREQFAEQVGISPQFLAEIENGKKGMSQDTIIRLCSQFHISADYLLFGESAKQETTVRLTEIAAALGAEELDILIEYLVALRKVKALERQDM